MFLLNNFSPLKKAAIFNWWQKMHISKNSPTKISKLKQINISEKQVDSKQTENFNYIKISEVWHLTLKLSCRIKKTREKIKTISDTQIDKWIYVVVSRLVIWDLCMLCALFSGTLQNSCIPEYWFSLQNGFPQEDIT